MPEPRCAAVCSWACGSLNCTPLEISNSERGKRLASTDVGSTPALPLTSYVPLIQNFSSQAMILSLLVGCWWGLRLQDQKPSPAWWKSSERPNHTSWWQAGTLETNLTQSDPLALAQPAYSFLFCSTYPVAALLTSCISVAPHPKSPTEQLCMSLTRGKQPSALFPGLVTSEIVCSLVSLSLSNKWSRPPSWGWDPPMGWRPPRR